MDNLHAEQIIAEAVERATGGGGGGATDPNGLGAGDSGTCPQGTTPVTDGCLETAVRDALDFDDAALTCASAGRRLAPVDVLLAARQVEAFDLGEGEMSGSISTPLSVDLNQALEPLGEPTPFRCFIS